MSESNKEYLQSEDLLEPLPEDPLLSCLITLARFYHKPATALAFTAGLPLVNNRLTPELFVRAASRIDLAAKIVKKPLLKINPMLLPAVLILKNNHACIVTEINPSQVKIIQAETGGTTTTDVSTLQEQYTGYAILVQPAYEFSSRSQEVTTKVPQHWFWGSIYHTLPVYGEVLLAALLINLFAIALPLFAMNVYDRVVPNAAVETLWVLAIGVVLVFCFDFLMRTLRGYFIDVAGKSIDLRLSAVVFEQALGIKMASRPGSVGAFVNTVQGFEIFRDFITSSTVTVLVDIPFTFIFLAIIAVIGGTLAIIPLVVIPIVVLVGYILQLPMARLTQESYRHAAEKQATLIESLGGIEAIKSEGAEGPVQRRFERVVQMASLISLKLRMYSNTSINFAIFIQQLTSVVVVIFGVYKIAQGNLTVGGLIAVTLLTGRALAPMSQVAALIARYHQAMNALYSLDKVMKMPVERPHGKTMLHRANFQGQIQFRDVSFLYPGQSIEALYHVSFMIKPGEHVAIIGRVGSGKSTVAKLILGLYQPTSGSILLDDTELNQIDPAE
jgi:ATP-binding cassette subfamily C protein LapB